MNKLFIRVFGGLLLALLVVCFTCIFLYHTINLVRSEHHRVLVSTPVFDWLASQNSESLTSTISSLSAVSLGRVSIEPSSTFSFSTIEFERLSYGQVLVLAMEHGYIVVKALEGPQAQIETLQSQSEDNAHVDNVHVDNVHVDNAHMDNAHVDNVIVARFPDLYSGVSQMTGQVVFELLNQAPSNELLSVPDESRLAELSRVFGVDISLIVVNDKTLHTDVRDQLALSGRYFYSGSEQGAAFGYYQLPSGAIYRIDFCKSFDSVSWPLIFMLVLIAISGVAAAVYLLISSIDRRLKSLETVASRIARGELDARITVVRQDAIGRLGNAFNSMAEHIQRLVSVQREMIHAVSHELRTPVARIRFGIQMIEDSTSEKYLHKQLAGIDSDIQELDELIDEILTYARLEQGGPILTFQDVDVKDIVKQVVAEQSSVKPEMTIEALFDADADQWKQSDVEYRYIHRAVQNLVGNATRYASSTVKVRCAFDKDTCRIDVEDDGAGIPEEDWEKVFTPFARLDDSRTRSSGGYGLGLSIVRRILFWHGGQAFLGRSDMGGAKFSLVWPRRQMPE